MYTAVSAWLLCGPDLIQDLIPDLTPDLIPDLNQDLILDLIPDLIQDLILDLTQDLIPDFFSHDASSGRQRPAALYARASDLRLDGS